MFIFMVNDYGEMEQNTNTQCNQINHSFSYLIFIENPTENVIGNVKTQIRIKLTLDKTIMRINLCVTKKIIIIITVTIQFSGGID